MKRAAGVLLPVFSLPSKFGIGCFDSEAYRFVDWLHEAGQTYWQLLPLGPTGYGDSPYQSFSTFAGNPYFISLEELISEGVLSWEECESTDFGSNPEDVDYAKLYNNRFAILRTAYSRSDIAENWEYQQFVAENAWWLDNYAMFMAVKDRFGGKSWLEWADDIKRRLPNALDYYGRELYFDIEFYKYLQFKFYSQWRRLKKYANDKGIEIIGDIPIYVAMNSADAWTQPELFQLDGDMNPVAVSGCPPDGPSDGGQVWGNPLYRWDYHARTGYQWWMTRLWHCFEMYDVVRIDHFKGFDEYYSIPFGDETAVDGHWEQGPGIDLFYRMFDYLGERQVIAEDLGFITDSTRRLLAECGFPGMRILQFGFNVLDRANNEHSVHRYPANSVAYTGTHDNQTISGWFQSLNEEDTELVREYAHGNDTPSGMMYQALIALAMRSNSDTCIIPLQDYMGRDDMARINSPSSVGGNWRWRALGCDISEDLAKLAYRMAWGFGRLSDYALEAEWKKRKAAMEEIDEER